MMVQKQRFGPSYLQKLYDSGYRFCIGSAFSAAVTSNRGDVLDWWIDVAKLGVPRFRDYYDWDDSPIRLAVQAEAWDSLDWLARGKYHKMCDDGLTDEELADLVRTGDKRQLQFVALWLAAGFGVLEYIKGVIEAACEMGAVEVLQGWVDGHDVWFEPDTMDEMCAAAVNGQGPVAPVLEWMLNNEWAMPNLAEYASKVGNLELLEWWKKNKVQIDAQVRAAYMDQERELDPASDMELVPEWLSEVKHGYCLDLARENGHEHVVDWWMQNLELLVIPESVEKVDAASGNGDLEFLKFWNRCRGPSPQQYDCDKALCQATTNGQLAVLEWWFKESHVQLKFDIVNMLRCALASGGDQWKAVTDWWMSKSGIEIALDKCSDVINCCDNVAILDRWEALGRFIPVDETSAIIDAAQRNDTEILQWWADHDQDALDNLLVGNTQLMDSASLAAASLTLEWIRKYCNLRGIELCYSEKAMSGLVWDSAYSGYVFMWVIKWWCESGLELKYTESAFLNAVLWISDEQCKWWLEQSLPIRYTKEGLDATVERRGPWITEFAQSHGTEVLDGHFQPQEARVE
ncbi:hypothetical protein BCR44DRAFT_39386 [Catenaria anguillulae PL171]|uniref:Ankyrin repeat-containing domain protein n=1 Tax=Catenaria anguillulae PL171 TaxID=765915 RepID=A0A1Y2HLM2_9FUNG|nr:hypothetical protein BCR44DRAFT_39386 [Catenaria anguillulae PL171]